jgi:hypothetical protein
VYDSDNIQSDTLCFQAVLCCQVQLKHIASIFNKERGICHIPAPVRQLLQQNSDADLKKDIQNPLSTDSCNLFLSFSKYNLILLLCI